MQRPPRTSARPEIQALRAFAVLAVVLYHLWPNRLPGGYVGVDIFFAISGYLIIGHLLREVDRTGRVALLPFWARRVRRLLPASLLVIVVTGIATLVLVPTVVWQQWFREMGASALYIHNWLLASDSVDYLGAENAASPTQHFWSLSVEEQFYIVTPLAITVVLAMTRRVDAASRRALGIALGVVTVASLVYSMWHVASDPAPAYFVTQSRAWEFGAGGILALVAAPVARDKIRAVVSWGGVAVLVGTVLIFSGATPFPGAAALLPVFATLAVIWAGDPRSRLAPVALIGLRPVQWLGDISYSFYLWHWAPIVILPFVTAHQLTTLEKVGIIIAAALLAWATKLLVEDPVRSSRGLSVRPSWLSITGGLGATAVVVLCCLVLTTTLRSSIEESETRIEAAVGKPCVGALAVSQDCEQPYSVTQLTDPAVAQADIGRGVEMVDRCKQGFGGTRLITCEIGDTSDPELTLALVGDSHAGHLVEALDEYGSENGVKFVTMLKTWCAGTGAENITSPNANPQSIASCTEWGRAAINRVTYDPEIDGALFSNFTRRYLRSGAAEKITTADFRAPFEKIRDAEKEVIALRDIPQSNHDAPACVAVHDREYDPCTSPRADAVLSSGRDPVKEAASEVSGVGLVDLDDLFCDASRCHSVIGGLVVYFDKHHMTAAFSRTTADIVGREITAALK